MNKSIISFILLFVLLLVISGNFAIAILAYPLILQNLVLEKVKSNSASGEVLFVEIYQLALPFFVVAMCILSRFEIWQQYEALEKVERTVYVALGWSVLVAGLTKIHRKIRIRIDKT